MGYLSHDYWPSLLCISNDRDHVRFFNLTNTRNQGSFRYYRCSKCTSLKTTASSVANMMALNSVLCEIDNNEESSSYNSITTASLHEVPVQFSAPKIQINGMNIVSEFYNLIHHPECRPIPIPAMVADQLDRRARRQVSLGLLEPRDAWTQVF